MKTSNVIPINPLDTRFTKETPDVSEKVPMGWESQIWKTVTQAIDTLSYANHPKYTLIQDWVGDSKESQEWFKKNKASLFSDNESITVAWFALALKPLEWLYTYTDGIKWLSSTSHTKYPDWRKVIDALPWNEFHKSDFIQKILGLPLEWYRDMDGNYSSQGRVGSFWSSISIGDEMEILSFFLGYARIVKDNPSFAIWVLGCK